MTRLARLAIQRRWVVIASWLGFIVIAQVISGALGGANYKDTFSLPGTETQKVMDLLKNSGQKDQNGLTGQVVLHAKSGDLTAPPANVLPELQKLCGDQFKVTGVTSPWGSFKCSTTGTGTTAPAETNLLSKDKTIGIVNVNWYSDKYEQKLFDGVYKNL